MPDLRIASNRSDQDFARQKIGGNFRTALRQLAANVMRIARGAGKPDDVLEQMQHTIDIAVEYKRLFGRWPDAAAVSEALHIDRGEGQDFWLMHQLCRAAMMLWAGKLAEQSIQASKGESDLFATMLQWERDREKVLQDRKRQDRAARRVQKSLAPKKRSCPEATCADSANRKCCPWV